jgi:hypothetical protein
VLAIYYRLEDLEAFEQREVRILLRQVLQHERLFLFAPS